MTIGQPSGCPFLSLIENFSHLHQFVHDVSVKLDLLYGYCLNSLQNPDDYLVRGVTIADGTAQEHVMTRHFSLLRQALLPLMLTLASPAGAGTWVEIGYEKIGYWWIDISSVHTNKGITYWTEAFTNDQMTHPSQATRQVATSSFDCKRRINAQGYMVPSMNDVKLSGFRGFGRSYVTNMNKIAYLVCPEGSLSLSNKEALKHH